MDCFRLTLVCGGVAMNSLDELSPDCLGKAGLVYEHTLVSLEFITIHVISIIINIFIRVKISLHLLRVLIIQSQLLYL